MSKKKSTQSHIKDFIKKHGIYYDYSLLDLNKLYTTRDRIVVICPNHGEFKITIKDHKHSGCKKCGYNKISKDLSLGDDVWLKRFKDVHGDLYKYKLNGELKQNQKINIVCKVHGIFNQSVSAHYHQSAGCPKCYNENRNGFVISRWINNSNLEKNKPKVYFIKLVNDTEDFYKIGITYNSLKKRFSNILTKGYKIEVVACLELKDYGKAIAIIENEFHKTAKKYSYKPKIKFKGDGECYKVDDVNKLLYLWKIELELMRTTLQTLEDITVDISDNIRNSAMSYRGAKTLEEFKQ